MENLEFVQDIHSYTIIEKISEGYSGDDKYKLEKDGKFFLLRVGDLTKLAEKRKEYDRLAVYADTEVNTHKPIAFGTTSDHFYSIVSWVDGTPVMDVIKKDPARNYYPLGRSVGAELKKLHSVSAQTAGTDWDAFIAKKAEQVLDCCYRLNVEFTGSKEAEQYILSHLHLASGRPSVLLHGDFHWNNCVVDDSGRVGIIDFLGTDAGDPWYEFGGLLWALEYSESFANGQIDGYFGTPPDEFWSVFKLYTALYAFEHLMYTNGSEEDIRNRIRNAVRILGIYGENFELDRPRFRKEY